MAVFQDDAAPYAMGRCSRTQSHVAQITGAQRDCRSLGEQVIVECMLLFRDAATMHAVSSWRLHNNTDTPHNSVRSFVPLVGEADMPFHQLSVTDMTLLRPDVALTIVCNAGFAVPELCRYKAAPA